MLTVEIIPWIHGLLISVTVLLIASVLIFGLILSAALNIILRRITAPKCEHTAPPSSGWKISKENKTSRENRKRKPDVIEAGRITRVQSMITAHVHGLRRLHKGRKRGVHTRKAVRLIMKKAARDSESDNDGSKKNYIQLSELKRAKEKELHGWVKGIEKTNQVSTKNVKDLESMAEKAKQENEPSGNQDKVTMETVKTELSSLGQCEKSTSNKELDQAQTSCEQTDTTEESDEVEQRFNPVDEIEGIIKLKLGRNNKIYGLIGVENSSYPVYVDTDL